MSRYVNTISNRFHFIQSFEKNKKAFNFSLFDNPIQNTSRFRYLFTFESYNWLKILIAANDTVHIGIQPNGQWRPNVGAGSAKNSTEDYINYTKTLIHSVDSLSKTPDKTTDETHNHLVYGEFHIKNSNTYINTQSMLTAYDWFKDSAFNEFIKAMDVQHIQDRSRLLLVLTYFINNISLGLYSADIKNNLSDLLDSLMNTITKEFNPIPKENETLDTTLAELIAHQIFSEYYHTSWLHPDNPFIFSQRATTLKNRTFDFHDSEFINAINNNIKEITSLFNDYYKSDNQDGFIEKVFLELQKQQLQLKFSKNSKPFSSTVISKLKQDFKKELAYGSTDSTHNKEASWKQLLIRLDEYLNMYNVDASGLINKISSIKHLSRQVSINSKKEFWERISEGSKITQEEKLKRNGIIKENNDKKLLKWHDRLLTT